MFFVDGYVCGGMPTEPLKVIHIKVLSDMMMLIAFNNGETRLFDATILSGAVFSDLQNEEVFRSADIDHGIVVWKDGEIDCAPEYMYEHSFSYENTSLIGEKIRIVG